VLTSALSSCNSGIFASARMLYSLAGQDEAPHALHFLSRTHVPAPALAMSGLALGIGVVVNVVAPQSAFVYIISVSTVAILWVWGMVAVAHLRYRARRALEGLAPGPFAMPGSPWTNYVVLVYLALVAALLAVTPDPRVALVAGAVAAVLIALGWRRVARSRRRAAAAGGPVAAGRQDPTSSA
jgi:amino acid transporter, AAT family